MIQLDSRYAPLPVGRAAILRQKTLLGETYVELTPGTKTAPSRSPRAAAARPRRSSPTVELDEIFRAFDPQTRAAFQVWMQTQAQAIKGHGRDINDALGNLGAVRRGRGATLLDILHRQEAALAAAGLQHRRRLRRADRARRPAARPDRELQPRVRDDGARATSELQEAFVALPTFERESRATLDRLDRVRATTPIPLVTQLRPAARELSPTLSDLAALAPDLQGAVPRPRPADHRLARRASRPPSGSCATCSRCSRRSTRRCAS